jgi:hypothetical protein
VAEYDRAVRADGVHHGASVVDPHLERWETVLGHAVRHTHPSFVEDHHP